MEQDEILSRPEQPAELDLPMAEESAASGAARVSGPNLASGDDATEYDASPDAATETMARR